MDFDIWSLKYKTKACSSSCGTAVYLGMVMFNGRVRELRTLSGVIS
mgnify:CR=1 FL=1